MKIVSSLLLLMCLYSVPAFGCSLETINKNLSSINIFVDFVQTKNIKNLSRPLISKGQIWKSPDGQLVWQTQTPIKSTIVMNNIGIQFYNKHDQRLENNNQLLAENISDLFLIILSGETDQINNTFVQKTSCDNKQWRLDLVPKNPELSKLISQISIQGSEFIETISYREQRGDATEIGLTKVISDTADKFKVYLEQ